MVNHTNVKVLLLLSIVLMFSCGKMKEIHCESAATYQTSLIGFDTSTIRELRYYEYIKGGRFHQILDSSTYTLQNTNLHGDTLDIVSLSPEFDWRIVLLPATVEWNISEITVQDYVWLDRASSDHTSQSYPKCELAGYTVNAQHIRSYQIYLK